MQKFVASIGVALFLGACGGESGSPSPASAPETLSAQAPSSQQAGEAAPVTGKRAFAPCAVCHKVGKGERSFVGPNLYAIVDAPAGAADDFAFTDALRNSGIVWTEENLDAFIENPSALIPGNRMAYAGEKRPERRAAIIEYLKNTQGPE